VRQSHLMITNAAVMWTTQVLNLVPQLVLVPFLIGTIGESGYGIYALVWPLLLSIDLLEMSLQQGVVKDSAAFLATGRIDEVNKVVSSSFVYSVFVAAAACLGILAVSRLYAGPSGGLGRALTLVGLMVLLIIPLTPYVAVIQSRRRYDVGAIALTASKYVGLAAVIVWFRAVGPSIEALIVITMTALFLSRLAQVPVAHRLVPGLRNRPGSFDGRTFRRITVFGAAMVLVSLCLAANSTGIRWLMGALESTGFVARLAIMLVPGLVLSQGIYAVTLTIMPATSSYEASGNVRMLKELLIRSMRYTTILIGAVGIAAVLLMRGVLSLWVGREYAFLAPYALALLAGLSFMLSTSSVHHMLKGLGRLRAVVLIYLVGLVIVPVAVILAVHRLGHDPYAAVTAGLAAGNLVCGCLHIGVGVKLVRAGLREMLGRVYASVPLAAAAGLVAFAAVRAGGIGSLPGRAAAAFIAVLLFFAGCYGLISTPAERKQLKELPRAILSTIAARRRAATPPAEEP